MKNIEQRKPSNIFIQYINDLDTIGKISTLIGLIPTIIDGVYRLLGKPAPISSLIALVGCVAGFGLANFRLYKKTKKPGIDVTVTEYSCNFSNAVGHNLLKNEVFISEGFHLDLSGKFDIYVNDVELQDAYFNIDSINTNWDIDLSNFKDTEIKVEVPKSESTHEFENPVLLTNRNAIPNCHFSLVLPINIPENKENQYFPFKYIGSLKKFEIVLGADIKGGKRVLLQPMRADIDKFLDYTENQLIQIAIKQARQHKPAVPIAIFALRDLWKEIVIKKCQNTT